MTSPSLDCNIKLQRIMRRTKRTIEPGAKVFHDPASAPRDVDLEVLGKDAFGSRPVPFPCRLTDQGWVNSRTGAVISPRVVGWRKRGW